MPWVTSQRRHLLLRRIVQHANHTGSVVSELAAVKFILGQAFYDRVDLLVVKLTPWTPATRPVRSHQVEDNAG